MRIRHVIGAGASAAVLGLASASQATPFAYEPFNYTYPGALTNNVTTPDSGSSGLSGKWTIYNNAAGSASISSGSLSNPSAPTTSQGNSLQVTDGPAAGDYYAALITMSTIPTSLSDTGSGGTLFLSAVLNLSSTSAGKSEVQMTSSLTRAVIFGVNDASHFGMESSNNTFVNATDANGVASVNTPTLVVVELVYAGAGSDDAYLFVNPSQTLSTSSADVSLTGLSLGNTINDLEFFSGDNANSPIFDEFRAGSTFADVIGAPEPASFGILGVLGAIGLLRRRRAISLSKVSASCG